MRKSPKPHTVRSHKRKGKTVRSYMRGRDKQQIKRRLTKGLKLDNLRRGRMLQSAKNFAANIGRRKGVKGVYIAGSVLTSKKRPRDIDIVVVFDENRIDMWKLMNKKIGDAVPSKDKFSPIFKRKMREAKKIGVITFVFGYVNKFGDKLDIIMAPEQEKVILKDLEKKGPKPVKIWSERT